MSERILLATADANTSTFIAQQALRPQGYKVEVVSSAIKTLEAVSRFSPSLIIADIDLSDLSGKDLLVALCARGCDLPVMVVSKNTQEGDILQVFRLGAVDFLSLPAQVTEVVAAVDRILRPIRAREGKRTALTAADRTNQELRQRMHELRQLISISNEILAARDYHEFLNKTLNGAIKITKADYGWIWINDGELENTILVTSENLPPALSNFAEQIWREDLTQQAITIGKTISLNGEYLTQFPIADFVNSIMITPLKKVKGEAVGTVAVIRQVNRPFSPICHKLIEALMDMISIMITNQEFRFASNGHKSLVGVITN